MSITSRISTKPFNTLSTSIQHPALVDSQENGSIVDAVEDTEVQQVIQHSTKDEGERGCVEQGQFDDVLQNEQQVNLPTANLDSNTSQKEAFQEKYQPVEVFNSKGEWISGYWVHKCLVVANLEGIERKYAPFDELEGKYAFWRKIRLPRC